MARRSQCSSAGDNPLDPNYLPPHYREEYRLAIDALVEEDLEGYYQFLQKADVVDFLSTSEIQYIQSSVQVPRQSNEPEQHFLETGADGSSGTYWPIHSDLDVPGLDLGWPQPNPFLGPTEVTTLINPPEPDMPSIKEQARRLIKNAQQVVAIVMDMFTDVDMFADILSAAMRNVAVYILLDEQNAHHFINMVSNCRVDLQSIQCLCVRTVCGSTYQCRSGKSFKGQVMDRFLLTDCRAVLSGNYSFMWSFEKLHRCMAHLFLGQLVTTFDEEFRILFAQSQPLVIENALAPMEDLSLLYKRQYPNKRTSLYREPKKFRSLDISHSDEWVRHPSDERMDADWRMMALKRQESHRGPVEMYARYAPQQSRLDPCFDQGPSRIPMMDNPAFKRHSYAEGVQGRYSLPFLQQQGMPDSEPQGKHFQRGQQPFPGPGPGPEADYSGYDKFWNQDYYSADQYSEQGLPQDVQPPDNFDPVFNYLSSTRNLDFDQSSEKLQPAADLPFSSSYPRRRSLGQPYACQTSPTPSSSAEQKQFFLDPTTDRKDPMVKRGLRDWRISSFLSAYEDPAEEGLLLAPPQAPDPFEEPPNPIQQTAPVIDFVVPKIPNVREFKVPAIPRTSQMPSYAKTTTLDQPKKVQDEPATVASETKATQRPSEAFAITEGEKTEEAELKEPKTSVLRRDDSFRRNYNTAVQRSSRLRSSLIFSSLEQQQTPQETTTTDQSDEQSEKNETELTKLPFVSHVLGQRRSGAREPFDWSRSIKSATFDNSSTETSKADDKESSKDEESKDLSENPEAQEPLKLSDVKQDNFPPSAAQSKPSEAELPKTDQPVQPPKSLLTSPLYVDMNDPDQRLMFFKELAAKRRAAKAAEAEKTKEKAPMKPAPDLKSSSTSQKAKPAPNKTSECQDPAAQRPAEKASKSSTLSLDVYDSADKKKGDSVVIGDSKTSQSCSEQEAKNPAESETTELDSEPVARLPVSAERNPTWSKSPDDTTLSISPVKESVNPPTPVSATLANVASVAQVIDERESPGLSSTSKESISVNSSSVEVPASSTFDIYPENPKSVQLDPSVCTPPMPSQISPSTTLFSNTIPGDSSSAHSPNTLFLNTDKIGAQDSINPLLLESSQETSQKSDYLSSLTCLDSAPQLTTSETPSAADSAQLESNIFPDTNGAGPEPKAFSSPSTMETSSEETSVGTSEKGVSEPGKDGSGLLAAEEWDTLSPSKDIQAESTAPNLNLALHGPGLFVTGPESSVSEAALKEADAVLNAPADTSPRPLASETSSHVCSDVPGNASLSETTAFPQDTSVQATPPHHLNLTDFNALAPAETVAIPPLTEADQSLLPHETEKTETDTSAKVGLSDKNFISSETAQESEESPVYPSTKSPSSPTDSTSEAPAELDLPCKTAASESHASEAPVLTGSSIIEPELVVTGEKKTDNLEDTNKSNKHSSEESVNSEKTNDQVKQSNSSEHTEITSKQPKSNQSRYHSSTANVLSSSNLRDDTKLLLEQISANCQNRNEATKEPPVTDDEKEDEADKNAKKEKERGFRTLSRGPPKSSQERDKLLERIQSMRKERKVYSRFEMAP